MDVNNHHPFELICQAKAVYIISMMPLCVCGELLVTIASYEIGCPLRYNLPLQDG